MLVLTRKLNEKLIINGNIEVVVLEASKNSVRLGVRAPNDVQIYREEIYREIQSANESSLGVNPDDINKISPTEGLAQNFDLTSKFIK